MPGSHPQSSPLIPAWSMTPLANAIWPRQSIISASPIISSLPRRRRQIQPRVGMGSQSAAIRPGNGGLTSQHSALIEKASISRPTGSPLEILAPLRRECSRSRKQICLPPRQRLRRPPCSHQLSPRVLPYSLLSISITGKHPRFSCPVLSVPRPN